MTDSIENHADSATTRRDDILTRIAERRERFVLLIRQLTGASAARAERVFRPLPFVDSRRPGVLGLTALALALMCAAAPAPAAAQSGSIGVWGGVFTPLKTNPDLGSIGGTIERKNSFIGGARLTFWGTNILGLELVAGYTPANVSVAGSTVNGNRKLNELVGGAKLMLGLTPAMSPVGFHIGVGPAFIRRGKDVGDPNRSESNFGGVAGAGLRIPISQSLGLRIDAEDYFYGGDFGGGKDFTNDLVLSAGLHLNFGGK
jgi:hypothetical protein